MKQIKAIPMWDNGKIKEATILNCYGVRTIYGVEQENYYSLFSQNENGGIGPMVAQGNLTMTGEAYQQWGLDDNYAWDWIAEQLGLTIIGDWVEPEVEHTAKDEEFIDSVKEAFKEIEEN